MVTGKRITSYRHIVNFMKQSRLEPILAMLICYLNQFVVIISATIYNLTEGGKRYQKLSLITRVKHMGQLDASSFITGYGYLLKKKIDLE